MNLDIFGRSLSCLLHQLFQKYIIWCDSRDLFADKKAFLSNQCKEINENNRMGKTRDLFKKKRYQGNISCKNGLDKGQKWYGPNRSRRY